MTVIEVRDGRVALRDVAAAPQQISIADRVRQIWPVCVVGLGLAATVAWMGLLAWMVYRAVLVLA